MNNIHTSTKKLRFLTKRERKQLEPLISKFTGHINAILERDMLSRFGLNSFQSLTAKITVLNSNQTEELSSGGLGVASNKKSALFACIGESLERYAMSFYSRPELLLSKHKDLDSSCAPSKIDLNIYGPTTTPVHFKNATTDLIHWVKIKSAQRKKELYWPAALVYLPFHLEKIAETTSTGIAAGKKLADSILGGTLEIIERDAQMMRHYSDTELDSVDTETLPLKLKKFIKKIQKYYNLELFILPAAVSVPTFGAYVWTKSRKKGYHFGIGSCSHLDSNRAVEKALIEALFTYFYSMDLLEYRKDRPKDITALFEHFLFYQGENFDLLRTKIVKKIPYKATTLSQRSLFNKLSEKKFEVYYKDITSTDLKDSGFTIARVVIPRMIDLNKSHILPKLGQALRRGIKPRSQKLPHPFP